MAATCTRCGKEMKRGAMCAEGMDVSVLGPVLKHCPQDLGCCPDCDVAPGSTHHPGCDMERCLACGGQAAFCACETGQRDRWRGVSDGHVEAVRLGLFCRTLHLDGTLPTRERPIEPGAGKMRWHEPCDRSDPGAQPDFNRWVAMGRPRGAQVDAILQRRAGGS